MALLTLANRILLLDKMIRERETGQIDELAAKLGISRRQTYNYLQTFRKIGKMYYFDPEVQSYVYLNE